MRTSVSWSTWDAEWEVEIGLPGLGSCSLGSLLSGPRAADHVPSALPALLLTRPEGLVILIHPPKMHSFRSKQTNLCRLDVALLGSQNLHRPPFLPPLQTRGQKSWQLT